MANASAVSFDSLVDFPPEAHAKGWCPHPADELVPSWEIIREAEDAGDCQQDGPQAAGKGGDLGLFGDPLDL